MSPRSLLTIASVADRLGVTKDTVRRLIARRELVAVKIGQWRVEPADLEAFIEARKTQAASLVTVSPDLPALAENRFA